MNDNQTHIDIEARQQLNDNIEKNGCHLVLINPDNYLSGFVYSIGLYKKYPLSRLFRGI